MIILTYEFVGLFVTEHYITVFQGKGTNKHGTVKEVQIVK